MSDALRLIEQFVDAESAHDIEAMDALFAPDVKVYANGTLMASTWVEYRPAVEATLAAFPDTRWERVLTVADGDIGAFRWRATGTHVGTWNGLEPTGNQVQFHGSAWFRVENGRIAEYWFDMDFTGPMGR